MNILTVQNDFTKGITITQMNCRVAYYCRVSTEKGDQLNSLENQKQYFENFIKENENWKLAGVKRGKFNLIITKEAS